MKILIHLKVVILVSEKWNEHNLMYIDHKQWEIMQKIQWNSPKANFTDFPLTDGAVVEPQCLCKWLQEIYSKRKSISVHCFCRVFAHFFGKFGALLPTTCMSGGYSFSSSTAHLNKSPPLHRGSHHQLNYSWVGQSTMLVGESDIAGQALVRFPNLLMLVGESDIAGQTLVRFPNLLMLC